LLVWFIFANKNCNLTNSSSLLTYSL